MAGAIFCQPQRQLRDPRGGARVAGKLDREIQEILEGL